MIGISQIIGLGILGVASIIDIKCREIPTGLLVIMNVGAIIYQCLWHREAVLLAVGGAAVGMVFLIVSRVTKESVGYGDSLGILALGIYAGLWNILEILAEAFFALALCAIVVLIRKKMSRKCGLPFYPFLTAAYIFWIAGEISV